MDRNPQGSPRIRRRYLDHNSKVALYVDLGNFCLFHLAVESASLNGGFGRALNSIRMIA
ncbi:pyridoxamine 5'-phosphate oxidase-related FMN-binding [Brucella canis ATCC 23365]|nr:pyridoxamine 5'-phosphate oxidase-related FMN-binding [Brucella canis ATCC 23365]ABY38670.1 pyridoxamine 5'-phosphate oxidase-related FMN-binding [Brucella suis ATCC 23445]ACO01340.1 pyridoxamine 5'-phosphate oxidase-related FMN-binding [Brucella melitensis ATCC 23457]